MPIESRDDTSSALTRQTIVVIVVKDTRANKGQPQGSPSRARENLKLRAFKRRQANGRARL